MKITRVWCEWDIGISNIDGQNYAVFSSKEEAIKALEVYDWKQLDYSNWQEVEDDGLLGIREIEIK